MYKVTEKEIKGQIAWFPLEVVQRMVEHQVNQGNEADVTVFQKNNESSDSQGGFDWYKAEEGYKFWRKVIMEENFNIFFKKYPMTASSILGVEEPSPHINTASDLLSNEPKGVKLNKDKIQLSKLFIQFPQALKAVMLASTFGHIKYEETDEDWLNFKAVQGGSEGYEDALFRHYTLYNEEQEESGLPPQFHRAWNAMASLQLFLEEQKLDVDKIAKDIIPKWRLLKTQNKLNN